MLKISLKVKSIVAMLLFAVLLAATAIVISYRVYSRTMDEHYKTNAMNIAKAAASQMDGDKISEYIEKVESLDKGAEDYEEAVTAIKDEKYYGMFDILFDIKKSHEVLYLYVEKVAAKGVVYVLDADKEGSACQLGETYPLAPANFKYLNSLEKGLPGFITNTKDFGWLCSAGAPIFDNSGKVVALTFVDVSMGKVMADRHKFLLLICAALILAAAAATAATILLINKFVVSPINALSTVTSKFVSEKNNNGMEIVAESAISKLKIHTGDEIENLSEAIKTMEKDINTYIKNLTTVTAEKERIGAELNVATQIQASMLPCIFPAFPEREEFDIYATMQPAKEVGGDFYDFFLIDNDHLAVVMADVSGKGVPAALFMVIAKTLIKNQAQAGNIPEEVFTTVNAQLCETNEAGMFVTGWMGVLEISTGKFIYVNAGHNPPLIKKAGGKFEYLKSRPGFVLAGMEGIRYRQVEMQLDKDDELYLYTDGVTEATDAHNELYGEERLQKVLNENLDVKVSEMLPSVKADIDAFVKEAPQFDDITMLALKIKGRERKVNTKIVPARLEELDNVLDFINTELEARDCPMKIHMQINIAVEEIFVNIAHYAYAPKEGNATIRCLFRDEPRMVEISFIDGGMPYNPLEKADPDVTLAAEDRQIGGLGILMVKKSMDEVIYEYTDNKNSLTIKKLL